MTKCIVKGCSNQLTEGKFVGNLCAPCFSMLTTGKENKSEAWFMVEIESLRQRVQELEVISDGRYKLAEAALNDVCRTQSLLDAERNYNSGANNLVAASGCLSDHDAAVADVNHFRKALSECQAREAKMREALECAVDIIGRFLSDEGWLQEDMDNADWIGWVLIQPQDDSALQEALAKARKDALLDVAKSFTYFNDAGDVLRELRRMAEEQK